MIRSANEDADMLTKSGVDRCPICGIFVICWLLCVLRLICLLDLVSVELQVFLVLPLLLIKQPLTDQEKINKL